MKISGFGFLRAGNMVAPSSGAILRIEGTDLRTHINSSRLSEWLRIIPCTIRVPLDEPSEELGKAFEMLVSGLAEYTQLESRPTRILSRSNNGIQLWLPADNQPAAKAASMLAEHILSYLQENKAPDAVTAKLWKALSSHFWNQTHAHLARAARQMGVPFYRLDQGGQQFLQLGQGSRLRLCHETLTDQTPLFAEAATNKQALHALLQHRGVPLPAQKNAESMEEALAAAESIGWPVVLKPANGRKGKGVWVGLSGPEALRQAWQANAAGTAEVQLVQQTLTGADHRLLVVNGSLMAVAQRQPASLCCDGKRSLHEQIEALNANPERGVGYERLLNRVPVDSRSTLLLNEQGFTLNSVPQAGTRVQLSRTANISQGGTAIDCSDHVHPDNRRLAEDIAQLIGTDVVGLDLISRDIGVSWRKGGTWLLEANLSPGVRPHLIANPQSDLCQRIVRQWVGDGPRAGQIPTALITGSIGKTTTSRMLAHILQTSGLRVGLTSTTGMELDGHVIASGDRAGGGPAQQLLQDRRVEAMVAEIARGGILKAGLGLGPVDVAAVLNVLDNHVGIDGIRNRNDLARIKAIVAQAAESLVVLNADDPLVLAMAQHRSPHTVALVSEEPGTSAWHIHRRAGHLSILLPIAHDGHIQLFHNNEALLWIKLRDIPASDEATISSIAPAAAFSAALAHGIGLSAETIHQGLISYGLQSHHRQGRFETLVITPWKVVLTWADGAESIASLSRYVLAVTETKPSRKILLCSAPDNRPDEYLQRVGQATWGFDLVICAAWEQRRGRPAKEVPTLLAEGVHRLGPGRPAVLLGGRMSEAVNLLAQLIQPGDLCVVCSFETEETRRLLFQGLGS